MTDETVILDFAGKVCHLGNIRIEECVPGATAAGHTAFEISVLAAFEGRKSRSGAFPAARDFFTGEKDFALSLALEGTAT